MATPLRRSRRPPRPLSARVRTIFANYEPDQFVELKANPDYFKGEPAIESVIWKILPTEQIATQRTRRPGHGHRPRPPQPGDFGRR